MGTQEEVEEGGMHAGWGLEDTLLKAVQEKCSSHAGEAMLFGLQPGLDPVEFLSTEQTDIPASP
jgi:hypothetical protein